jgi:hypothetical protein
MVSCPDSEENEMDGETGSRRRPWRMGALALVAAFVMLTAGCGFVHVHFGSSAPAGSVTFVPNRAFAQCVRSHGVPSFPKTNWSDSVTVQLTGHAAMARAYHACKHLLGQ